VQLARSAVAAWRRVAAQSSSAPATRLPMAMRVGGLLELAPWL
jgi:hypothetical protein